MERFGTASWKVVIVGILLIPRQSSDITKSRCGPTPSPAPAQHLLLEHAEPLQGAGQAG